MFCEVLSAISLHVCVSVRGQITAVLVECIRAQKHLDAGFERRLEDVCLVTRPIHPAYRETCAAIPPRRCVSSGVADYRCYTPTSFHIKMD